MLDFYSMLQIPVVLFLQWLLAYQDKFAKHYADGLDGCGLEQEKRVRTGYYSLVRCLVEPFQTFRPHAIDQKKLPAYDFIQACLLHLLDTQWQVRHEQYSENKNWYSVYSEILSSQVID